MRYKMLVLSRPVEGQEQAYNDWYQHTHLKDVTGLPGFISAQRFKLAVDMMGEGAYPYAAIYEIETEDPSSAVETLRKASGDGSVVMSSSLDTDSVYASIYQPLGEPVEEA